MNVLLSEAKNLLTKMRSFVADAPQDDESSQHAA